MAVEMEAKTVLMFVMFLPMFSIATSHHGDISNHQGGSGLLQQAIKYLVNYTAAEAEARLDINNIGSTVAAIAYHELTEKLGR